MSSLSEQYYLAKGYCYESDYYFHEESSSDSEPESEVGNEKKKILNDEVIEKDPFH